MTYRRRPVLCDPQVRSALRVAVKAVQLRHPFTIDAWVLLPEHLHCIWTLPSGDADYSMQYSHVGWATLFCPPLYRCKCGGQKSVAHPTFFTNNTILWYGK